MHIVKTDSDIMACLPVMRELRRHLEAADFVGMIRQMQAEGYVLACLKQQEEVVCVAGYYISTNLSINGKALYVYDLVTAQEHRSAGHGEKLLNELKEVGRAQGCVVIHLDSGVNRFDAHRFYLNHGFHIASYHFSSKL